MIGAGRCMVRGATACYFRIVTRMRDVFPLAGVTDGLIDLGIVSNLLRLIKMTKFATKF